MQDLSLLLQSITSRLKGGVCKENADIGLKVLLGKLTFKEASAQANFLFDKRKTNSGIRYAKVTIGDIKGIVLLPDDWNRSNYVFSEFNESDMSYSDDIISQNTHKNKYYLKLFFPFPFYF